LLSSFQRGSTWRRGDPGAWVVRGGARVPHAHEDRGDPLLSHHSKSFQWRLHTQSCLSEVRSFVNLVLAWFVMWQSVLHMHNKIEEIRSCPITPRAFSGVSTPKAAFQRYEYIFYNHCRCGRVFLPHSQQDTHVLSFLELSVVFSSKNCISAQKTQN